MTVTVATPTVPFGVYVSVPVGEIAGAAENSAALLLLTPKLTVWPASFAGPTLMFVAHPVTVCAVTVVFGTLWFAPFVKLGTSLTEVTVIDTVAVALPPLPSPMV